jgi:HJR/Mrr/RecB family endonuclease
MRFGFRKKNESPENCVNDERIEIFKIHLQTLQKGSILIFKADEKFVRFVGQEVGYLILIPKEELSDKEEKSLLNFGLFSTIFDVENPNNSNPIGYQAKFKVFEISKATLLVERIFIKIFKLPKNFEFEVSFDEVLKAKLPVSSSSVSLRSQSEKIENTEQQQSRTRDKKNTSQKTFNINTLDGHEFESLVESLIKKMGFTVEQRKLTADGGVDILAHSHQVLFEGKYVIQCKRYNHKVPESPIRDLYGVVHSLNANKGILITNSTFTRAALDFAKDKQIELIDGATLMSLLAKYTLIRKEPYFSISEPTAYLFNNFVSKMKKQKLIFDDIESGYFERKRIAPQQFISLAIANADNNSDFNDWWIQTMNYFISELHEKPLDYQRLGEIEDQLVIGLQKHLKNYKTFVENVAPPEFATAQKKLSICNYEYTNSIFNILNDLEKISDLSADQLEDRIDEYGVIRFNYTPTFSRQSMIEANDEFSRACRSARRR